ncbi:MAG: 30S ribosomal protein S18 [Candidatus Melainabacteria bacterium]
MARFTQEKGKKQCFFLANKIYDIDLFDLKTLTRFMTDRGKILPRRITGTSPKMQRKLSRIIKRARQISLVSHTSNA